MNPAPRDHRFLRRKLQDGDTTCADLVDQQLGTISRHEALNAFTSLCPERARRQAADIDRRIKSGKAGKLAGLIVAIKDILAYKDEPLSCGSRILADFIPPYTATAVQRLIDADAVIIGKTNMDEFAMGSSNENSYFGPVKNPHDPERIPGGSSGGSAAAVAAGMVPAALGSDTGGSVRQPAAMCGVVGLKPSYGRVSRYGLVAFASSLDQIGPITACVEDSALILSVIAGHDAMDSTSADIPVPDYMASLNDGVAGLSVACPREFFTDGLSDAVAASVQEAMALLRDGGATVEEVSLPHADYAVACYYVLATAEASANLARYDGVRYGFRAESFDGLTEMYAETRSLGFGEEVKRRIMLGTYVLSAGYYDAYYDKAQRVRTLIKQDFDEIFAKYDCILGPTAPTTAFRIGEKIENPLQMYLSDIYTISANLAGIPGLSIPFGVDGARLPIGVQLLSQAFDESSALRVGAFLQHGRE